MRTDKIFLGMMFSTRRLIKTSMVSDDLTGKECLLLPTAYILLHFYRYSSHRQKKVTIDAISSLLKSQIHTVI